MHGSRCELIGCVERRRGRALPRRRRQGQNTRLSSVCSSLVRPAPLARSWNPRPAKKACARAQRSFVAMRSFSYQGAAHF
jgi:hypothetical protein